MNTIKEIPTLFIVLGATGDLMGRKIVPALFRLFERGSLPIHFKIIGFSRRELSDDLFRARITEVLEKKGGVPPDRESLQRFLALFQFQRGTFDVREDYDELAAALKHIDDQWGMCTNKLFYLAVPPEHFETIFGNLDASGLTAPCSPQEGWMRVIIEKPFGDDLATAEKLDDLICRSFQEEQIYRIDHYPAKQMLQNILTFRFSNSLFERNWNSEGIEAIHMRLWESLGVETRGAFYDKVGALRDVGQNHLLQMLALITMEHPQTYAPEAIRARRTEILERLIIPSPDEVRNYSFRAQYEGYRGIERVGADSDTETYFKMRAFLDTPRWQGVPIIMEAGKRIGEVKKEIVVIFRHPQPCICPTQDHYQNKIIFSFEPEERILIQFLTKKPGLSFEMEERVFEFTYREVSERAQYSEEYEKLIVDCICGDQTLFVSTREIRAMWRFVDSILSEWRKGMPPLARYEPDTREATEQSRFIEQAAFPL